MSFARQPLAGPETLGERLRQLRIERRLDISDISRVIHVPEKYIQAIESGRYSDLPGLVYAKNFVRQYAAHMALPPEAAMTKFLEEYQVVRGQRKESPRLVPRANTEFPWYIRHARFLFAAAVITIVVVYLAAEVTHLLRPPQLVVLSPSADLAVSESSIVVSGRTESGVAVRINNQSTEVDASGTFTDRVDLQPGLNTIKVSASRKYSQPAVVERRVLLEVPK